MSNFFIIAKLRIIDSSKRSEISKWLGQMSEGYKLFALREIVASKVVFNYDKGNGEVWPRDYFRFNKAQPSTVVFWCEGNPEGIDEPIKVPLDEKGNPIINFSMEEFESTMQMLIDEGSAPYTLNIQDYGFNITYLMYECADAEHVSFYKRDEFGHVTIIKDLIEDNSSILWEPEHQFNGVLEGYTWRMNFKFNGSNKGYTEIYNALKDLIKKDFSLEEGDLYGTYDEDEFDEIPDSGENVFIYICGQMYVKEKNYDLYFSVMNKIAACLHENTHITSETYNLLIASSDNFDVYAEKCVLDRDTGMAYVCCIKG